MNRPSQSTQRLALLIALWLGLLLAGAKGMLRDPGTFWHLACGQQVLLTGELPRSDLFTFTMAGKPWVDNQWMAECVMAVFYRLGGWDGVVLLTATLLTLVYGAIACRLLERGLQLVPTVLVVLIVLAASAHQFHARPLVGTILFLGITYALLLDIEFRRRPAVALAWLLPLFALWANVHGGVLGGLATVGLVAAGWSLAAACGRSSPITCRRDHLYLILVLLGLGLIPLVNPYGLELVHSWRQILAMPLPEIIQEHRPLQVSEPYTWMVALLAVVYTGVALRSPWRVTTWVPLVWLFLACMRGRHAPLAAVVMGLTLAEILSESGWAGRLVRRNYLTSGSGTSARPPSAIGAFGKVGGLVAILLTFAAVIQATGLRLPLVGRGRVHLDPQVWPVELDRQLADIAQPGRRVFNDMQFGGYLLYRFPAIKLFIDDRCELFGTDFLQAYNRGRTCDPARLEGWCAAYDLRYALVQKESAWMAYLGRSRHWRLCGECSIAALYEWAGDGSVASQR